MSRLTAACPPAVSLSERTQTQSKLESSQTCALQLENKLQARGEDLELGTFS